MMWELSKVSFFFLLMAATLFAGMCFIVSAYDIYEELREKIKWKS